MLMALRKEDIYGVPKYMMKKVEKQLIFKKA